MESFNSIINGDKPVLVDFHADWCGPCKAMAPAVAAIGKDVQGRARVLKINIDRNHAISQQFNVQAVPTFIIFKTENLSGVTPGCWRKTGYFKTCCHLHDITFD